MQRELEHKFPDAAISCYFFEPHYWSPAEYQSKRSDYDGLSRGEFKKSVVVYWNDGPAKNAVEEIINTYCRTNFVRLDSGYRRVENIGFDVDGNPVVMGLLENIFLERCVSDDVIDELIESGQLPLESPDGMADYDALDAIDIS